MGVEGIEPPSSAFPKILEADILSPLYYTPIDSGILLSSASSSINIRFLPIKKLSFTSIIAFFSQPFHFFYFFY